MCAIEPQLAGYGFWVLYSFWHIPFTLFNSLLWKFRYSEWHSPYMRHYEPTNA